MPECSRCLEQFILLYGEEPFRIMARGSGPICPTCQKHIGIGIGSKMAGTFQGVPYIPKDNKGYSSNNRTDAEIFGVNKSMKSF
jgi:hypothetical protein